MENPLNVLWTELKLLGFSAPSPKPVQRHKTQHISYPNVVNFFMNPRLAVSLKCQAYEGLEGPVCKLLHPMLMPANRSEKDVEVCSLSACYLQWWDGSMRQPKLSSASQTPQWHALPYFHLHTIPQNPWTLQRALKTVHCALEYSDMNTLSRQRDRHHPGEVQKQPHQ